MSVFFTATRSATDVALYSLTMQNDDLLNTHAKINLGQLPSQAEQDIITRDATAINTTRASAIQAPYMLSKMLVSACVHVARAYRHLVGPTYHNFSSLPRPW